MAGTIFTVGHSTHPIGYFLELLRSQAVNCVVDVRSVAASQRNPQYNKEALSSYLSSQKIAYLHFGEEFGARQRDPSMLGTDGKVDFEKVRKSRSFQRGVERLKEGLTKGYTIALMCSESDPLDCHRFSMISIALEKDGFDVVHILKDKTVRTNAELESQMLRDYARKLPEPTIFKPEISQNDRISFAYRLKNEEIGYSPSAAETQEKYD